MINEYYPQQLQYDHYFLNDTQNQVAPEIA